MAFINQLIQSIRRLDEYEAWRRSVFLRDRFTCQQCGKRNGRKKIIEVHHQTSLSILVRENNITSIDEALSCPILWEVDNGLTLCKTCHQKTDSYPQSLKTKSLPHGETKKACQQA